MNTKLSTQAIKHLNKLPLGNSLKKYIENRSYISGDFITAVITNDLCRSIKHADNTSLKLIADYANFFTWYAPEESYGSMEKLESWIKESTSTATANKIINQ